MAEDTHVDYRSRPQQPDRALILAWTDEQNPRWTSASKWIFFLQTIAATRKVYRVEPSRHFSGSEGIARFPQGPAIVQDASGNSVEFPFRELFK